MNNLIAFAALMLIIYFSATLSNKKIKQKEDPISYTQVDVSSMSHGQTAYVPVHSKLSKQNGSANLYLNTILKIRSTSFYDSTYISAIDYYDQDGKILKHYLNAPVLLKPMATLEILVKDKEHKGKGDNFIVVWHAEKSVQAPIIHSISSNVKGKIAFSTNAVVIDDKQNNVEETVESEI